VPACTGNGNPSTTHTLLSAPPVRHATTTDSSNVPPRTLTLATSFGSICSPPMLPILPHDGSLKAFGPSPPAPPYAVAKAESQAIEDL